MHACRTCALVLLLAGCGRTGQGSSFRKSDAAAGSGAFADATIDSVANSADARACRWAGFAPESTYVSSGDTSIAVGDFNGDGHPDVVVTAWGNGTPSTAASGAVRASVFLNQGNGAFAPAASYNTDMEATSVAVGDFNGDGKPDFAVLTVLDQIDLFVNQGDGTFASLLTLAGPQSAVATAAADFNRDGHPDLAVTTQDGAVDILFGDGNAGFAAPITYAAGDVVDSIAVGDLNGDGFPDIVVSNAELAGTCPGARCLPTGLGAGTVNVLINQGDGTFAPQVSYPSGNGTASVAVGDLNGDGAADIAATNSVDNTLSVFFNAGDGTFTLQASYANAGSGTAAPGVGYPSTGGGVVAADFNGDGHVDIVVVQTSPDDRNGVVLLLANAGDGTLLAPVSYTIAGSPDALAVADFNGDGLLDLAVTSADNTAGEFVMGVFLSKCE
ncbi:MAG: VCBS repeat-containing protein [Polyangia bacterium]